MCGITGWVDFRRDLRAHRVDIDAMTDSLALRGPDARGIWIERHAAIGHRRLAVIDLEGGVQPMVAEVAEARVVLTFSGEIYNFVALRRELAGLGHDFRTRSDTEVVLRAYLEWGADCLPRFDGMFAFGVWDGRNDTLFLARDRLGVKPLYYHQYGHGLVFGSEPKALLASPVFDAVLDDVGLTRLFAMFGTHQPGHGVLRGLSEVRPGWSVTFSRTGVVQDQYWALTAADHVEDWPSTVAHVRTLLDDIVSRQLTSDVPLCALVSGGVDSSAIAVLAARQLAGQGQTLSTFSVDFHNAARRFVADENRPALDAPYVAQFAAAVNVNHRNVVLDTPDILNVLDAATQARDLPCLGDLDASLLLLFQAIRGKSTVALSGESADEVFGGYAWFHDPAAVARPGFPWSPDDEGFAGVLRPELKARLRPGDYVRDQYARALAETPVHDGDSDQEVRMRQVSYLALTRFLPVLLDRKDRMSMASALEVRVPFCDHRLVEYLFNTPWALKNRDGNRKAVLRAAVSDLLPEQIVQRPKSMYPSAVDDYFDAAVRRRARALLDNGSVVGEFIDRVRVEALIEGTSARPPWLQRLSLAYLDQIDRWLASFDVRLDAAA